MFRNENNMHPRKPYARGAREPRESGLGDLPPGWVRHSWSPTFYADEKKDDSNEEHT